MATTTTRDIAIKLDTNNASALDRYAAQKAPATVVSQTPPAGTPLIQGMTVQVRTVSLSDVPLKVLVKDAPVKVQNVALNDMAEIIEGDDKLKDIVTSGKVPNADDTVLVTQQFNRALQAKGYAVNVEPGEMGPIVLALNAGFGDG